MFTDSVPYTFVFLAYLPYGEEWADIRDDNAYSGSAYKFNGKEKDPETGYNYYGARYYTDRLSIWLSVDPLTDKYPSLSGYNYCANNPVRFIDPDGRDFDPRSEKIAQEKESHIRNKMSSIDNQIAQNKQNGVDNTQLIARREELNNSLQDIDDMRNDHSKLYKFKTGRTNITTQKINKKGQTIVSMTTIFQENFDANMENHLHEMRHGGQIARGELTRFDANGNPSAESTYSLDMEVSAYRAQFAWSGRLYHSPILYRSSQLSWTGKETDYFKINRELVKNFYEFQKGQKIYLYRNLP